ncbi:sigma-54-dependent Fis family transcriptional regulator [Vibrio sp. SCSIO 43136]|uniref:sigma-54-dependent Fis family transcriptional regulator n=1 Tax=Vibrio sp. SCSIO 43136 TaxID=2819101 RepID=UPI002075673C|nr:sigma-54-dependent Fis family transcriptional regulator [Vibrio sp. SCSIO 43136]USD64295.1 sigma-54-dependent Fis family transcriptional regulator [Vibrio sp. SCSIO 43136]
MHLNPSHAQEWLASSWQRSKQAGLSERRLPEDIRVSDRHLAQQRSDHAELIDAVQLCALPLFNQLFAHTDSRLILTDNQGVILASWGQPRFKERLTSIALSSGSCWQEKLKGTNAIGTALVEAKPVTIIGEQHFIQQHRFISCSAIPIKSPLGDLVGVLDITSEQQIHDINTQMLVHSMVQQVENRLLLSTPEASFQINIACEPSLLGTHWQGILITSETGRVVAHNQIAGQILAQSNVIGYQLDSLLQGDAEKIVYSSHPLQQKRRRSKTLSSSCDLHFGDRTFEQSWQQATRVIDKDISIMILGETGVGKNEFVKALHNHSHRRNAPLISVNCGALARDLVEAELFGYEAGAFTGANPKGSKGKIRLADKGILFLDEIGDLPLDAQSRLLHVLQDKTVVPLGSGRSYSVDARIIAATHKDLEQLVAQGLFRQDLYYRLNGLVTALPKLAQREDKAALIQAIHQRYCETDQQLCPHLNKVLMAYHWPGNIRELDNLIKVASLMAQGDPQLNLSHVPEHLAKGLAQTELTSSNPESKDLKSTLEDTLVKTYQANQGNISKTSRMLGISRNTLYRKLKAIGLIR